MAARVCLRCDWEGETDAPGCPRCGAELYRPAAPRSGPPSSPAAPDGRRAGRAPSPRDGPSPEEPAEPEPRHRYLAEEAVGGRQPGRRGRSSAALSVVVALVLAAGVWWFLHAHEVPRDPSATPPPAPGGRLVYVSGGPASQRLWIWDPRSDVVQQGPALDGQVLQLVSAQGELAGWLGVTTRGAAGLLEASLLRSFAPGDTAAHVFTADRVAWGSNGGSVATVVLGEPAPDGCYATLDVDRERLDEGGRRETVYHDERFCGEVTGLGQTVATTYLTVVGEDGVTGTFVLGNGALHETLQGWTLIATSATSDLLVRPAGTDAADRGTALYWRGADEPDRYRGPDGGPVLVDRILTWTTDPDGADGALVVGTVAGRRGLYLLDTTPGGDRAPRYVGAVSDPVTATSAFDGSLYVAMPSGLFVWRDGHLSEVELPPDSPRPDGPIAWLPG